MISLMVSLMKHKFRTSFFLAVVLLIPAAIFIMNRNGPLETEEPAEEASTPNAREISSKRSEGLISQNEHCCLVPDASEAVLPEEVSDRAGNPAAFFYQLQDGLLSVDIQAIPLEQVLKAISEEADIEVLLSGPAEEEISLQFTQLHLDKGLERILKGRDYAFYYRGKERSLRTVHVYFRKDGETGQPSPARRVTAVARNAADAKSEFQALSDRALLDPDPAARLDAVEDLNYSGEDEQVADILEEVLAKEASLDVRKAALEAMADFDEDSGVPLQAALISVDDSRPAMRSQAIEIFTALEAWEDLAYIGTSHNDEETRRLATQALENAE